MQEELPRLLALQGLDLQIGELIERKRSLDRVLSEEKAHHSSHLEDLEREKTKLLKLQSEIKNSEIELESLQGKRNKLEAQQAAVKTNQEYKALNKEILDTCAEVDGMEEAMIQKLDEIDAEKKRLGILQEEVKEEEIRLHQDIAEVEQKAGEVQRDISGLNAKREKIIQTIDSSILRVYQKVFDKTGGPAVVPINNRTCGGCHLTVTAQIENMTRRNEELILCENCSRILYYKQDDLEE
jgi:predicted  nucleic acid-binding Zn-ribbon protein